MPKSNLDAMLTKLIPVAYSRKSINSIVNRGENILMVSKAYYKRTGAGSDDPESLERSRTA